MFFDADFPRTQYANMSFSSFAMVGEGRFVDYRLLYIFSAPCNENESDSQRQE